MKILQKKQQTPRRRTSLSVREGRASADELSQRYAFRRNRTLTGSLVSDVGSAGEYNSELRSPRVQTHHLRKHRRRLFFYFVGVLLVVLCLFWLIYESIARVYITVEADIPPTTTSIYEQGVQNYLNSHIFERSRLTIDTGSLVSYLQENGFPEVAGADIEPRPAGFGASTIRLVMRRPVVTWKTGATQLFVDAEGTAFGRSYYATPQVEVVDQTGIQTVNNQVLASDRFLSLIGLIIGKLAAQGFTVSRVVLPENTTRQLLISIEGVSYPVKFSVDRPAGEQAEDAARAIRYLTGRGIGAEYVDVRISGKAYYK